MSRSNDMSFLDHLEELRWHIIRSTISVLLIAIVAFLAKDIIFDQIIFGQQTEDISYARDNNGSNEWIYSSPSPLSQNQIMNTQEGISIIKDFSLSQNYPNPFNPITTISYTIPINGFVNISVYDIVGRRIKSLVNNFQYYGSKSVIWDGTNSTGKPVAGGMYFYLIQIENFKDTKKMLFIK